MTAPLVREIADDLVRLRGTDFVIFRRTPGSSWRVDADGVRRVLDELLRLGYRDLEDRWSVNSRVGEYLRDVEHFCPGTVPGAAAGLTGALGDAPAPLPGETIEALGRPSFDRSYTRRDERAVLRDSRCSLREMHLRIREDIKVEPAEVALRPLVVTTENAARAQWHYGAWGVYRYDSNRQPEKLVAVYGHFTGGFGAEVWHFVRESRDDPWSDWRPRVSDFSAVRCAVTGRVLYEWGRPMNEVEVLTPELFVRDPDVPGVSDLDEVVLADDPTDRPTLRITK